MASPHLGHTTLYLLEEASPPPEALLSAQHSPAVVVREKHLGMHLACSLQCGPASSCTGASPMASRCCAPCTAKSKASLM